MAISNRVTVNYLQVHYCHQILGEAFSQVNYRHQIFRGNKSHGSLGKSDVLTAAPRKEIF